MQNIVIGVVVSISPVGVKFSSPDRCPSWKIQTIAPNVADKLNRFKSTAFTGTRRLPAIRNRTTKVTRPINPSAYGTKRNSVALESTSSADGPPTWTGNGADSARTCFTRSSPRFESGSTEGTTDSHVPVGEAKRPEIALG